MAIRRYYAEKDNSITNAFKTDLINSGSRATGSNMGQADILEVFSLYRTGSEVGASEAQQLSLIHI